MPGHPAQLTHRRRVLVARPPEVPSYFNAGHHLGVFTVSAHLRRLPEVALVDALDADALNVTWKEVADHLHGGGYDVIAVMNDLAEVEGLARFLAYARRLCPQARVVTFGRLSHQVPGFFERYDLDGIVASGDYEPGVAAFLRWAGRPGQPRPGVSVRTPEGWLPPDGPGRMPPAEEWALPDVDEIPYQAYDRLYLREENRFCGLPGRRELVVPVARGCPIRCGFCEVWGREGLRERRLPVERVVAYVEESFARAPFDYVAMYAPTFTLQRRWTLRLCDALEACRRSYPWKCSTTLAHLDEALLERMAASGCVRVSVGLETLDRDGQEELPAIKRCEQERFDAVSGWCARLGVELNCFVMVGLPGASLEGTRATVEHVRAVGARVRPTIYTPYHELRADMDEIAVARFNRQLFADPPGPDDAAAFYALVFEHDRGPGVTV